MQPHAPLYYSLCHSQLPSYLNSCGDCALHCTRCTQPLQCCLECVWKYTCLWTLHIKISICCLCQVGESSEEEELVEEECETMAVAESTRDDLYDEKLDEDEEQMLEKYTQERLDQMFPDEVDTPRNLPARVR